MKKKYGSGYRLILTLKGGGGRLNEIEALLPDGFHRWEQQQQQHFGDDESAATVCFEFPAKEAKIGRLILELEKNREAWNIEQCVITQTR